MVIRFFEPLFHPYFQAKRAPRFVGSGRVGAVIFIQIRCCCCNVRSITAPPPPLPWTFLGNRAAPGTAHKEEHFSRMRHLLCSTADRRSISKPHSLSFAYYSLVGLLTVCLFVCCAEEHGMKFKSIWGQEQLCSAAAVSRCPKRSFEGKMAVKLPFRSSFFRGHDEGRGSLTFWAEQNICNFVAVQGTKRRMKVWTR